MSTVTGTVNSPMTNWPALDVGHGNDAVAAATGAVTVTVSMTTGRRLRRRGDGDGGSAVNAAASSTPSQQRLRIVELRRARCVAADSETRLRKACRT
eukprot:gene17600-biopygen9403